MALQFGFYDSKETAEHPLGDRRYNAIQMSRIFDGLIEEGVYMNVGDRFLVSASGGLTVTVGTGRAWLNHTWNWNDDDLVYALDAGDPVLDRIDAVIIEIDTRDTMRWNDIRVIKGTPASIPEKPTLINDLYTFQYALAYITVPRGVTEITEASIEWMVGREPLPYIVCPLDTIDADDMLKQWDDQWFILYEQMQAQKEEQRQEYIRFHDDMVKMYGSIESSSFSLINNNFEDWSVKRGCDKITVFEDDGSINERIEIPALDFLLATRRTVFNTDGTITMSVQFFQWHTEEYNRVIETTDFSISKQTEFLNNGSIKEYIRN